MLDFSQRAELSEWMDEPCSYEQFAACLRDLERANRWTLAYRPTLTWLSHFSDLGRVLRVVDVGCGGGDALRRIARWAALRGMPVELTGVDLNPHARLAAQHVTSSASRIRFLTGDAFSLPAGQVDVVISSLFTHHLSHGAIVHFLGWMEETAALGWFVNDLERARLPYHGFRTLAWAMRWHPFVRHDGPVSVRRAFRDEDWRGMWREAGLNSDACTLEHWRPARLCVSRIKPGTKHAG